MIALVICPIDLFVIVIKRGEREQCICSIVEGVIPIAGDMGLIVMDINR